MTSVSEFVARFDAEAARSLDVFKAHFDGLTRVPGAGLIGIPRAGGRPSTRGRLPGVGEFVLHGRGCRFEFPSGAFVDVDWDSEGRAMFDPWRVLMFVRSSGVDDITQEQIREAMSESKELWRVEGDWFTWADRSYDIAWASPDQEIPTW